MDSENPQVRLPEACIYFWWMDFELKSNVSLNEFVHNSKSVTDMNTATTWYMSSVWLVYAVVLSLFLYGLIMILGSWSCNIYHIDIVGQNELNFV